LLTTEQGLHFSQEEGSAMIPASTLATLAGGLPPGGLPVLAVDAASLVPLLWALVGLVVAVVVARARRLPRPHDQAPLAHAAVDEELHRAARHATSTCGPGMRGKLRRSRLSTG